MLRPPAPACGHVAGARRARGRSAGDVTAGQARRDSGQFDGLRDVRKYGCRVGQGKEGCAACLPRIETVLAPGIARKEGVLDNGALVLRGSGRSVMAEVSRCLAGPRSGDALDASRSMEGFEQMEQPRQPVCRLDEAGIRILPTSAGRRGADVVPPRIGLEVATPDNSLLQAQDVSGAGRSVLDDERGSQAHRRQGGHAPHRLPHQIQLASGRCPDSAGGEAAARRPPCHA